MNRIKETPESERPRERAEHYGASCLTDTELIAVLLRTGTADCDVMELSSRVLSMDAGTGGLAGLLHHSMEEYLAVEGIGRVKAVQLLCVGELVRRIWKREAAGRTVSFREPSACADYYMQDMRHLEQEELRVAFLDTRMRLIADKVLTRGTVDTSIVSPREIMIEALKHRAVSLILLHNHPSGDPSPSRADTEVTGMVRDAGELLGIRLRDHIIIGDNAYYSFREWRTL